MDFLKVEFLHVHVLCVLFFDAPPLAFLTGDRIVFCKVTQARFECFLASDILRHWCFF